MSISTSNLSPNLYKIPQEGGINVKISALFSTLTSIFQLKTTIKNYKCKVSPTARDDLDFTLDKFYISKLNTELTTLNQTLSELAQAFPQTSTPSSNSNLNPNSFCELISQFLVVYPDEFRDWAFREVSQYIELPALTPSLT
jgi:hypothetical protein